MTVSEINAKVGVDVSNLTKGIAEAKLSFESLSRDLRTEGEKMSASARQFMASLDAEAVATKRLIEAKRQQALFERELRQSKATLTATLREESLAAQQVAGKYDLLSASQQKQLISVKEQITAQRALQEAEIQSGLAAEKAAAQEAAASAKAAKAAEDAAAKKLAAARSNLGRNLSTVGGALTGAITTPLAVAGGLAVASGLDLQNAEAQIRAVTGAQGAALAGLDNVLKQVAVTVPQSLGQVGQAVAALYQRTGLTGVALASLATQELNLARLTGSQVLPLIQYTEQAFHAWSISTASQSAALDLLFRVQQKTGVKVNELAADLARFAPALKTFGFSFLDAATLLGKFEQAGVPPQRVIFGLQQALTRLAKVGVTDAHTALGLLIQQLQHANSPMKAVQEAGQLFGRTIGVQVVDQIRKGTFNLDVLEKQILSSNETINKAAADTKTFGVTFGILRNQVEIALAPLGEMLLLLGARLLDSLRPAIATLQELVGWFTQLSPAAQEAIVGIVAAVALLGPALTGLGNLLTTIQSVKLAWAGLTLVGEGGVATTGIVAGLASIGGAIATLSVGWVVALGAMVTATLAFLTNFRGFRDTVIKGLQSPAQVGSLIPGTGFGGLINRALGLGGTATPQAPAYHPSPAYPGHPALSPTEFLVQQAQDKAYLQLTGQGGADPVAAAKKQFQAILDGLNKAEQGKGGAPKQPKLTPEQRQSQELDRALADERVRHAEILAGEGNIAARVAGKYNLLHDARVKELITLQESDKAYQKHAATQAEFKRLLDETNAQIRSVNSYHPEAKIAAEHPDFSAQQVHALANAQAFLKKSTDAKKDADQRAKEEQDADTRSVKKLTDKIKELTVERLKLTHTRLGDQIALANDSILYAQEDKYHRGLINTIIRETHENEALAATQKEQDGILKRLVEAAKTTSDKYGELHGTTKQLTDAQRLVNEAWVSGDDDLLMLAAAYLEAEKANEGLEASQKRATKALEEQVAAWSEAGRFAVEQQKRHLELTGTNKRLTDLQLALNQALADGDDELALWIASIGDAVKADDKLEKQHKQLQTVLGELAGNFTSLFENAFSHLNQGFKGFFSSIVQGFEQMLQQMAAKYLSSQIVNALVGSPNEKGQRSGGLLGGLIGNFLGGAIGGAGGGGITDASQIVGPLVGLASGGLVAADTPYLVGEHGPELFVPSRSGRIASAPQTAAAMAGGGNITLNMTVHTADAGSFSRSQHQISSDLARMMSEATRRRGR